MGLKPGEKLYEELRHRSEQYEPTNHPHVMRFVGRTELDEVALQKLVLEYTPYLDWALGANWLRRIDRAGQFSLLLRQQ
jgi:hypothetical protein